GREVVPAAVPRVLEQLPPELGLRIARIVADGDAVTLGVRDVPEVRLGLSQRVVAKGRAALAVLASTASSPPRYIDVRGASAPGAGSRAVAGGVGVSYVRRVAQVDITVDLVIEQQGFSPGRRDLRECSEPPVGPWAGLGTRSRRIRTVRHAERTATKRPPSSTQCRST